MGFAEEDFQWVSFFKQLEVCAFSDACIRERASVWLTTWLSSSPFM